MITDRIRHKKIHAGDMLDVIEHMEGKKEYDTKTLEAVAKHITKTAFVGDALPGSNLLDVWSVNEPFEVAELLRDLNHMISTLGKLWDSGYYLDYIFNAGAAIHEGVEALGITEDWVLDIQSKFEKLRSVLYGDCVDWGEVEIAVMRNAAYALREDNERLEDRNRKLEYEVKNKER